MKHVILVGCVARKAPSSRPARELYASELFRRRRKYAEAKGQPWFILSAKHGLVHPDDVIAPYNETLDRLSPSALQGWGNSVAEALNRRLGSLESVAFEIHAGRRYVQSLAPRLLAQGASVQLPLEGLRIGKQLQWYGRVDP